MRENGKLGGEEIGKTPISQGKIGSVWVRQAKPGGSCQLKGTDHGNCSSTMKLPSGVTGNRAVEAWGCDDVSRNMRVNPIRPR